MNYSELRKDAVSGDWIVMAPNRRRRPHKFFKKKPKRKKAPKKGCPFEDPQKSGNSPPYIIKPNKKNWFVQIFENKYPALSHPGSCARIFKRGPYLNVSGVGHQDLVLTRPHDRNFPHLKTSEANLVFEAFKERYLMLSSDPCLAYISIFHNWGPTAGASVYHPHYQIMALPIVPPDVNHSLAGSLNYFKKYKKCVHCSMLRWEQKEGRRIIYENKGSVVFAPYVSRSPFEIRIFPKRHLPFFEDTPRRELQWMAESLRWSLLAVERRLNDPDYNFFIHTSPVLNKKKYKYYHWHIEILPKISVPAGFELGTGIDINVVDPNEAALILQKWLKNCLQF